MKKLLGLFLLLPASLYPLSWPWSPSVPQPRPKVHVIKMFDPIKFENIQEKLYLAAKRPNIVGVIVLVDSCGGSFGDFSVIHDMVKKLASVKPVVCLVEGAALSCGYLVASASSVLFAHSISGIGGIGVYTSNYDRYKNPRIKNATIDADLKSEIFIAGEFKALHEPFAPELTERQRVFIQEHIMKTYDTFLSLVAQNRNLDKEEYKIWAEGKKFEAPEALELGLIDSIGTIFDAEDKIKELIIERNPTFGSTDVIDFIY